MPPPLKSIKYLYAAFAENSSCGAAYHDGGLKCGASAATAAADDGPPLRYRDGLEAGILSPDDEEVFAPGFAHTHGTPPQKHGRDAFHHHGAGHAGEAGKPYVPLLPPPPAFDAPAPGGRPVVAVKPRPRYAGPVMKRNSFGEDGGTASTTSDSRSRSTTPDSVERARGVTFREEKRRVPKSVNAPVSGSSSTLSRDDEPAGATADASLASKTNNHADAGPGDLGAKEGDQTSVASGERNKTDNSEASKSGVVSFTPIQAAKFDFDVYNLGQGATFEPQGNVLATSNMFTKEDLKAITPLQIRSYLSIDERKRIGTKVLTSKLARGYNLANGTSACDSCRMPLLSKAGALVAACPICPVLKKRVLKKILDGAAAGSAASDDSTLTTATFSTAPSTDASDASLTTAEASPRKSKDEHGVAVNARKSVTFASGIANDEGLDDKGPANNKGLADDNDPKHPNDRIVAEDSFLLKARKSLADAFKTNCETNCHPQLEARGSEVPSAALPVGGPPDACVGLEEGREAVARAGERMVRKVALVPEALKYRESDAVKCEGYEFAYGKEAMAHVSEVLAKNVSCSPGDANCEEDEEQNDLLEVAKDGELEQTLGIEVERDDQEEDVVVEDTSADAEDDVQLNGWKSDSQHLSDKKHEEINDLLEIAKDGEFEETDGIEVDQAQAALVEQDDHGEKMGEEDARADVEGDVQLNEWTSELPRLRDQDDEEKIDLPKIANDDELEETNGIEVERVQIASVEQGDDEEMGVEDASVDAEEDLLNGRKSESQHLCDEAVKENTDLLEGVDDDESEEANGIKVDRAQAILVEQDDDEEKMGVEDASADAEESQHLCDQDDEENTDTIEIMNDDESEGINGIEVDRFQAALVEQDDDEEKMGVEFARADAEDSQHLCDQDDKERSDLPEIAKDGEGEETHVIEVAQVALVEQDDHEGKVVVEDASANAAGDVVSNVWNSDSHRSRDQNDQEEAEEDVATKEDVAIKEDVVTKENVATKEGLTIKENGVKTEEDGTHEGEVSVVEDENVEEENRNGLKATHPYLEQLEIEMEDVIESPPSPAKEGAPLATISTSRDSNVPLPAEDHPSDPPSPGQRLERAPTSDSAQCWGSSSESAVSALGSTAKSVTSAAKSAVSDTLDSLMDRITQTKEKMFKTEDLNDQIQFAELLAKLSAAAVELKKLEAVA